MTCRTDDELWLVREEITFFLEWEGPLTQDEIRTKLRPIRLSMDEMIGCLSYLTDEGRIKREENCRYALTAKGRGFDPLDGES